MKRKRRYSRVTRQGVSLPGKLILLPQRVHPARKDIDDDF